MDKTIEIRHSINQMVRKLSAFFAFDLLLAAGIAALILLPLLDTYVTHSENWGQDDRSKDPR